MKRIITAILIMISTTGIGQVVCPDKCAPQTCTLDPQANGTGFTYLWDDNSTGSTLVVSQSGTYCVTVSDSTLPVNCERDTCFVAVINDEVLVQCIGGPTACLGSSTGFAFASPTTGTAPYTYTWTPTGFTGANTESYEDLPAGIYTAVVTDANGCSNTCSFEVLEGPAMTVSCSPTSPTCNGDSDGTITAFSNGNGLVPVVYSIGATTNTNGLFTNLSAGTYTVTATNDVGCTATCTTTIVDNPILALTCNSTDENCGLADGTISATATGGFGNFGASSYQLGSNINNTGSFTNLTAGTYTITATDFGGCTETCTVTINGSSGLTANITGVFEQCDGGTEQIFANPVGGTGPYTYNWSDSSSGQFVNWTSTTTYTVTVTDNVGCSATATQTVTANPNPIATCSKTDGQCGGLGTATVVASGGTAGYTFSWTGPNSFTSSSASISNLQDGIYTATVIDSKGCEGLCDVTIVNEPEITITCSGTDSSCNNNSGTATVVVNTGTGPYTYAWSNSANTASISNLAAGTYTVTVTDSNSCSKNCSYTVLETGSFTWNPGCS